MSQRVFRRVCRTCSAEFDGHHLSAFCCAECRYKGRLVANMESHAQRLQKNVRPFAYEECQCKGCGITFTPERATQTYCAPQCRVIAYRMPPKAPKAPKEKPPVTPRACKECGKQFEPWRVTNVYCSSECRASHTAKSELAFLAKKRYFMNIIYGEGEAV